MTLIEIARTMLSQSKLLICFSAEVVNTTCYTQNRTLINKDLQKTPYEITANPRLSLKYFYVFGAKCFVHQDEHVVKFDAKGDVGIFLSYYLESKPRRVYFVKDQKFVESFNVTFDDTKLPNIQKEVESEPLEFENLSDTNIERAELEATTGNTNTSNANFAPEPSV